MTHGTQQDDCAKQYKAQRRQPENPGAWLERRRVKHEVTVALLQKVPHLIITETLCHHQAMHGAPQVTRDWRVRTRKVGIETFRTAELIDETAVAQLGLRVGKLIDVYLRRRPGGWAETQQQHGNGTDQEQPQGHRRSALSAPTPTSRVSSCGSNSSRQILGLMSPTRL